MRIALVNVQSTFLTEAMMYPPLGLWYLGAQLENKGHECSYFDLNEDQLPSDGDFDQVWISATSSQMRGVEQLGNKIRNYDKTQFVIGGVGVWGKPSAAFGMNMDCIVSGEADYPDAIDQIIETAKKQKKDSVLSIPSPEGMDHILPPIRRWSNRYHSLMIDRNGKEQRVTTIFTSRGCPMSCIFCSGGRNGVVFGSKVRFEPIETVKKQIEEVSRLGFKGLQFYDDIMPINKNRTLEIASICKSHDITWRIFLRSDIVSSHGGYDYLKALKEYGLKEVCVGVESADNQIKKNINKGTTIEQDTQVLEWCKEIGIVYKASIILGLPGENNKTLAKTRKWILRHKPDVTQILHLIPFPGTPLGDNLEKYGIKSEINLPEVNWYTGNSLPTVSTSTEELSAKELLAFGEKLKSELKEKSFRLIREDVDGTNRFE